MKAIKRITPFMTFWATPAMSPLMTTAVLLLAAAGIARAAEAAIGWLDGQLSAVLAMAGTALILISALKDRWTAWRKGDLTAQPDPFAVLPGQQAVDLLIKRGYRVFWPHLTKLDLMSLSDDGYDEDLAAAARELRQAGNYIITGPKGITPDGFIEVKTSVEYRRRAMRRLSKGDQ